MTGLGGPGIQPPGEARLALGAVARADEDYARCEELFARSGQRLEYASARQDRAPPRSPAATCRRR